MQGIEYTRRRWPLWLLSVASLAAGSLACGAQLESTDPSGERSDSLDGCPEFHEPLRVGRVDEADLLEASGLVQSRQNQGLFWTHNDGDFNDLKLHGIDRSGALRAELQVDNTPIEDLEDIAIGPGPVQGRDYLYLADTGDNGLRRDEVAILRLQEPSLEIDDRDRIDLDARDAERFRFHYSDGRAHDAEALVVHPQSGELYLFTKRFEDDEDTLVFRAAPPFSATGLNLFQEVGPRDDNEDLKGSVVAADLSADGSRLALAFKSGDTRLWNLRPGQRLESEMQRSACRAPRPGGQQESIALSSDGSALYMLPEGSKPVLHMIAEERPCHSYAAPRAMGPASGLSDASGLAHAMRSQQRLWALSDSEPGEDRSKLVTLTLDGQIEAELPLPNAENVDWEDLAIGPGPEPARSYLYIGDIGDNELERESVQVYRSPEPRGGQALDPAQRFELVYPNARSHDAESLLVDPISGDLYIVTRQRKDDPKTRVFRARLPDEPAGPVALREVYESDDDEDLDTRVVAADISPDGLSIVLARKDKSPLVFQRHPDAPLAEAFDYEACKLPDELEDNDTIAFDRDGRSLYFYPEDPRGQLHHILAE